MKPENVNTVVTDSTLKYLYILTILTFIRYLLIQNQLT